MRDQRQRNIYGAAVGIKSLHSPLGFRDGGGTSQIFLVVTLSRYYAKTLADIGTNKVVVLLPAGRLRSFCSQAMKQCADGGQEGGYPRVERV